MSDIKNINLCQTKFNQNVHTILTDTQYFVTSRYPELYFPSNKTQSTGGGAKFGHEARTKISLLSHAPPSYTNLMQNVSINSNIPFKTKSKKNKKPGGPKPPGGGGVMGMAVSHPPPSLQSIYFTVSFNNTLNIVCSLHTYNIRQFRLHIS